MGSKDQKVKVYDNLIKIPMFISTYDLTFGSDWVYDAIGSTHWKSTDTKFDTFLLTNRQVIRYQFYKVHLNCMF